MSSLQTRSLIGHAQIIASSIREKKKKCENFSSLFSFGCGIFVPVYFVDLDHHQVPHGFPLLPSLHKAHKAQSVGFHTNAEVQGVWPQKTGYPRFYADPNCMGMHGMH